MSLPDTIFIFGLALVIFGPKKLPEIGRQLGKLVLEFRRASNEFKMQIEEELRAAELADRQKQIAAPPVTPSPAPESTSEALTVRPPSNGTTVSTESPRPGSSRCTKKSRNWKQSRGTIRNWPPTASSTSRSRQPRIMTDIVDRARTAVTERAELPGMSLLEHLEELRKRIIHSGLYLVAAFFIAYYFRQTLFSFMERPIVSALNAHHLDPHLVYLNPVDPFNFFIKISLVGGAILASPFILFQVWLFIAPGLYRHEKRYILPFMTATVGLFLTGAFFGYHYVYPGALNFLIGYGDQFRPMVTVGEYTELFMTVILGLGITFELPILVFFLALFGIVNAGFLWKNIRYAILVIFIIAAIITPTPDVLTMCVFAAPMLALYLLSIGVAYMVHPSRRNRQKQAS